MKIRQHEPAPARLPGGRCFCRHCGIWAFEDGRFPEERACALRDVPDAATLRPEPRRREVACEDAAVISARLAELAAERQAVLNAATPD